MIEQIWNKKIVAIIEINEQDNSDDQIPLPLIISLSWNSYIGHYYDLIISYFQMYAPFPYRKQQFHLTINQQKVQSSSIVYHIIQRFSLSVDQPIKFKCNFRSRICVNQIDLRRFFKNSLKNSTALKYGKYGAAVLTVQMSINNVQDMHDAFRISDYNKFLGSNDFQSDKLGYLFLIHKAQKMALKFVQKNLIIQRYCEKNIKFSQLIDQLFGPLESKKLKYRIHLVQLNDLQIKLGQLERYCHPDGYLYIHI